MADVTTDDYVALITSEHRDKPNFVAALRALTAGSAEAANLALSLPEDFDLDTAVGTQLDAIGLWIGIGRNLPVAIAGVYFTWGGTADTGWGRGTWKGKFDPVAGLVSVPDDVYRTMLRAKIAANIWDGTLEGMYTVWDLVFGPSVIFVQDNMDMTLTIIYDSDQMTSLEVELLINGYLGMKPMGVGITYVALTGAPIFAWSRALPKFQGWTGTSVWV